MWRTLTIVFAGTVLVWPALVTAQTSDEAPIRAIVAAQEAAWCPASFDQIPPSPGWSTVRMEDQYDAVLFMGDMSPTMSRLTRDQCRDSHYMTMRLGRMALDVPQARQGRIDGLKQFCAAMISE